MSTEPTAQHEAKPADKPRPQPAKRAALTAMSEQRAAKKATFAEAQAPKPDEPAS